MDTKLGQLNAMTKAGSTFQSGYPAWTSSPDGAQPYVFRRLLDLPFFVEPYDAEALLR
jgi:hypothetical protein